MRAGANTVQNRVNLDHALIFITQFFNVFNKTKRFKCVFYIFIFLHNSNESGTANSKRAETAFAQTDPNEIEIVPKPHSIKTFKRYWSKDIVFIVLNHHIVKLSSAFSIKQW